MTATATHTKALVQRHTLQGDGRLAWPAVGERPRPASISVSFVLTPRARCAYRPTGRRRDTVQPARRDMAGTVVPGRRQRRVSLDAGLERVGATRDERTSSR